MTCVRALLPGFARAGSLARRDGGPRPAAPLSPPPMLFAIYALAQPPFSPRHLFPIYPVPRPPLFAVHLRRPSPPVSAPKPLVPDPFRSRAPPRFAGRSFVTPFARARRSRVGRSVRLVGSFASLRFASLRQLPSALMNGTKGAEATGGYIGNEKRFTGGFQVRVM